MRLIAIEQGHILLDLMMQKDEGGFQKEETKKNGKCGSNRECKKGTLCSAWPSFASKDGIKPRSRMNNPSTSAGTCQLAQNLEDTSGYRKWFRHIVEEEPVGKTKILQCKFGSEAIGTLEYGPSYNNANWMSISWVGTDPSWQGQGVGKALLTTALNKIKQAKDAETVDFSDWVDDLEQIKDEVYTSLKEDDDLEAQYDKLRSKLREIEGDAEGHKVFHTHPITAMEIAVGLSKMKDRGGKAFQSISNVAGDVHICGHFKPSAITACKHGPTKITMSMTSANQPRPKGLNVCVRQKCSRPTTCRKKASHANIAIESSEYAPYIQDESKYGSMKPGVVTIMWVATDETYQGKGVGKALLTSALNKIKKEKSDSTSHVVLTVKDCESRQGNPHAERLYKRCGFHWRNPDDHKKTCQMYIPLKIM
uniref:N-acetyltransferase domain-containing protein n=1 Tax=Ditylenchus dipsaci TaxID=166011 RepID=A0A915DGD8_9BILA